MLSLSNFYNEWILDHSNDDIYYNNSNPTYWDKIKHNVIKYRRIIG
jgi:hypothetical protein